MLQISSEFYLAKFYLFCVDTGHSARFIEEEAYKIELRFALAYFFLNLPHQNATPLPQDLLRIFLIKSCGMLHFNAQSVRFRIMICRITQKENVRLETLFDVKYFSTPDDLYKSTKNITSTLDPEAIEHIGKRT